MTLTPYQTNRQDERFVSSQGFSHNYIRSVTPQLAFCPDMDATEFPRWQDRLRDKLLELMRFPSVPPQPAPKKIWSRSRTGYEVQKWEIFPEPGCVIPFLILIPDSATPEKPLPAIMCFPGSSGTKELMAGEPEFQPDQPPIGYAEKNRMALDAVKLGLVAVAVDNPCTGEVLERAGGSVKVESARGPGRDKLSRDLFYMGRSFLGLSVFQKMTILQWLKTLPFVNPDRIALAGHSLGTEPAMILGALDPQVRAVVTNDFVHGKRAQDLALAPSDDGENITFTGGMWHCVPGMWQWLDFPDILAALAPRFLLATEGGVACDVKNVRQAYELAGNPEAFEIHHFPKYAAPEQRPHDQEPMPEGLSFEEYYRRSNTDPPNHYFKGDIAFPWLKRVLLEQ